MPRSRPEYHRRALRHRGERNSAERNSDGFNLSANAQYLLNVANLQVLPIPMSPMANFYKSLEEYRKEPENEQ